ncbi:MAG TPA: hypothetical protein VK013_04540 [Myxococcaceae bacterium]|nr:hypothetical protein [Myxococcaceae bacterium]
MNLEDVDLSQVLDQLRPELGAGVVGYLRGKARMRDLLVERRGFSNLEAEQIIDTMEAQGFLEFEGDPSERSQAEALWRPGSTTVH